MAYSIEVQDDDGNPIENICIGRGNLTPSQYGALQKIMQTIIRNARAQDNPMPPSATYDRWLQQPPPGPTPDAGGEG